MSGCLTVLYSTVSIKSFFPCFSARCHAGVINLQEVSQNLETTSEIKLSLWVLASFEDIIWETLRGEGAKKKTNNKTETQTEVSFQEKCRVTWYVEGVVTDCWKEIGSGFHLDVRVLCKRLTSALILDWSSAGSERQSWRGKQFILGACFINSYLLWIVGIVFCFLFFLLVACICMAAPTIWSKALAKTTAVWMRYKKNQYEWEYVDVKKSMCVFSSDMLSF